MLLLKLYGFGRFASMCYLYLASRTSIPRSTGLNKTVVIVPNNEIMPLQLGANSPPGRNETVLA